MIVLNDIEFNPLHTHPHNAYRFIHTASKRTQVMRVFWLDPSLTWSDLQDVYLPCVGYAQDLGLRVELVIEHQVYQSLMKDTHAAHDFSAFSAFKFTRIRMHYANSLEKTRALLNDPLYYVKQIDYLKIVRYTGYAFLILALLNTISIELNAVRHLKNITALQSLSSPVTQAQMTANHNPQVHRAYVSRHEALRLANADAKGWINIPNTAIDFPLLQTDNNDYYLYHDYLKQPSSYGSIYLDYRIASMEDTHLVVYGHAVRHQAMLGHLINYTDVNYLEAHPNIEIINDTHLYRYQIFSVHLVDARVTSLSLPVDQNSIQTLYERYLNASIHPYRLANPSIHQILTLVSCEYTYQDGRIFVHAVLIEKIRLTPDELQ